jgi:hypothetical protein
MKNGFIFPCEPRLTRFEVNCCDSCFRAQLETILAVNPFVTEGSSKNLNQAGF